VEILLESYATGGVTKLPLESVLFIGIQGSGKSSFYRERFYATHACINRDMLKTAHRERRLIETCLETGQRFVIDNTNASRAARAEYIQLAKNAGFRVIGYYFRTTTAAAVARNEEREGSAKIPKVGIFSAYKRLGPPSIEERFDELYCVTLEREKGFAVEPGTPENLIK
jgi:predicted kinase